MGATKACSKTSIQAGNKLFEFVRKRFEILSRNLHLHHATISKGSSPESRKATGRSGMARGFSGATSSATCLM